MDNFRSHPLYRVHNIDSAMNSLWSFYKKNFLMLFVISAAMSLIIQYAGTFMDLNKLQSIQTETDPIAMLEILKGMMIPLLVISLLNLLFTTILQHYVLSNTIDSNSNIFTSMIRALKYYIPYLIILFLLSIFGSVAIILGIFVLVIGAFFAVLYVLTLYLFILPVLIIEGIDIGNTIRRVFRLVHRNFWTNIGWVAAFIVMIFVVSFILSAIIMIPFAGTFMKTLFNPEEVSAATDLATNPFFLILTGLANAITFPVIPILSSILYFNGRAREDKDNLVQPGRDDDERVRVEDLYAKPYSDDHPDNPEKATRSS